MLVFWVLFCIQFLSSNDEHGDPMPTHLEQLSALPYGDLRGIAIRLQLRTSDTHNKVAWATAIAQGWRESDLQHIWLTRLSDSAHSALQRLLRSAHIPTLLFLQEYGTIRRATRQTPLAVPPWQLPQSVSEELYYSGLLANAHKADSVIRSRALCIPADLRASLLAQVGAPMPKKLIAAVDKQTVSTSWQLCHDLAQLIIYLQQIYHDTGKTRGLLHGRWLAPRHLSELNQRLYHPLPEPLPRSHKQLAQLRLLMFLASIAEFHQDGLPTAVAWQWLAKPAAQQLQHIWQAWVQADQAYKHAYEMPDRALGRPWPYPILQALLAQTTPFTVSELAAWIWSHSSHLDAYWITHLADLQAMDHLIETTLTKLLTCFGVVISGQAEDTQPFWQVTPVGHALLTGDESFTLSLPLGQAKVDQAQVSLQSMSDNAWQLVVAAPTSFFLQATVAQFARYQLPVPPGKPSSADIDRVRQHHYRMDVHSVASAAAQGYGLATLLDVLAQLPCPLTIPQIAQLHTWYAEGATIQLSVQSLLQTKTAAQMAELCSKRHINALLAEIVSPTTAILNAPLSTAEKVLQQAGYFPQTPHSTVSEQAQAPQAALWIAGQLYRRLGHHLPLPFPLVDTELAPLYAQLSSSQQAVAQSQLSVLYNSLLTLLDNLPFTPPPNPTDPAQWRPLIAAASQAKQHLQMTYFSAGRNLSTQRVVEPYWIEEHHHTPYLRAYCHNAGRILTFRLDRIQALGPVQT